MTIAAGDRIPSATLKQLGSSGIKDIKTDEYFAGKKVVLFAVPGAFTPTCSAKHLPGFVDHADQILAKGVDVIACVSVNDPFVMDAWAKERNVGGKVQMLADGNAEFSKAMGLDFDGGNFGMGVRSQRYAAIVDDGVVKRIAIEKPGKFEVSAAEAILEAL